MRGKLAAPTLTALAVATAPASYADPGSDFLMLLGRSRSNWGKTFAPTCIRAHL